MDNQERGRQGVEKRARRAIQLEQERLACIQGQTPITRPSSPVTPDTVIKRDRWLLDVSDDRFGAATTYMRKIVLEVGGRYLGGQQFRVRLPGREHADGTAVLAIVVANTAGCVSEGLIGEWLKMQKQVIHTLVSKQFTGSLHVCLSADPDGTTLDPRTTLAFLTSFCTRSCSMPHT
jgi:hypothetical protein